MSARAPSARSSRRASPSSITMTDQRDQAESNAELHQSSTGSQPPEPAPHHVLQQHHRQQQSEPQLLTPPRPPAAAASSSRHRKRHSEYNLAGLGLADDSDAAAPTEEAISCDRVAGHEHLDHVHADADLPMSVERLATCLLTDGPWFRDFLRRRRTFGIEAGDFVDENGASSGDGIRGRRQGDRRNVRYWLRINYAIGPKQTLVDETQTYRWCEPGKVHIVDCEVHNRDIPYGTSFHTLNRLCLTSRGPGRSHLTVTSRTVFTRHVFLAKGFIESNVREGSQTYFRLMVDTLLDPTAGQQPVNPDDTDDGNGGASAETKPRSSASSASANANLVSASPSSSASSGAAVKRQDSVGRRRSSTAASAAAAAVSSSSSLSATAGSAAASGNRLLERKLSQQRSHGAQKLLLAVLVLACLLMLGCLFSLHMRFQSLDGALAQLRADPNGRDYSGNACSDSGNSAIPFSFSRDQLDIWRRALDETMGSLDGLLFELRRVASAATANRERVAEPVCSSAPRS